MRKLLTFKEHSLLRLIPCEVIARGEMVGWWQTVQLDKGRADGATTNLAVITCDGLVGKIVEVSRQTSTARLITDQNSKISCRFPRSSVFGIAKGVGVALSGKPEMEILCAAEPARMDYIAKDAAILKGDEVVTSGLGGVFPGDLLVGYVEKTYMDDSGLYQHADIIPAADLRSLTHVFIVLQEPSAGAKEAERGDDSPR